MRNCFLSIFLTVCQDVILNKQFGLEKYIFTFIQKYFKTQNQTKSYRIIISRYITFKGGYLYETSHDFTLWKKFTPQSMDSLYA